MCKKRKLKKDVCGRGFSVGRFKKALKTALDADETEDEILLALAQLISGHSVCADLGRYFCVVLGVAMWYKCCYVIWPHCV